MALFQFFASRWPFCPTRVICHVAAGLFLPMPAGRHVGGHIRWHVAVQRKPQLGDSVFAVNDMIYRGNLS